MWRLFKRLRNVVPCFLFQSIHDNNETIPYHMMVPVVLPLLVLCASVGPISRGSPARAYLNMPCSTVMRIVASPHHLSCHWWRRSSWSLWQLRHDEDMLTGVLMCTIFYICSHKCLVTLTISSSSFLPPSRPRQPWRMPGPIVRHRGGWQPVMPFPPHSCARLDDPPCSAGPSVGGAPLLRRGTSCPRNLERAPQSCISTVTLWWFCIGHRPSGLNLMIAPFDSRKKNRFGENTFQFTKCYHCTALYCILWTDRVYSIDTVLILILVEYCTRMHRHFKDGGQCNLQSDSVDRSSVQYGTVTCLQ